MWARIGPLTEPSGYEMFGVLRFLQHVPDQARARAWSDGGWTFNWPSWSPAAERDWRGFLTVDAMRVLQANGRMP
ncbi:MAG: hypothetical protein ACRDNT_18490 [Streptosporangiaceae bacterium]